MWICAINAEMCIVTSIGVVFAISAFATVKIAIDDFLDGGWR